MDGQLSTKNRKIAGCSWLFFGRGLRQKTTVSVADFSRSLLFRCI
jgi:hypothetical protein